MVPMDSRLVLGCAADIGETGGRVKIQALLILIVTFMVNIPKPLFGSTCLSHNVTL